MRATLSERLWRKTTRDGSGCWLWVGSRDAGGYGRIGIGRRVFAVHRVAYELLVEPIPDGLDVDHLCKVRNCWNPSHLEPVTHAENNRRSPTASTVNGGKTHCPQGHEYTPENTVIVKARSQRRRCAICLKEYRRSLYLRKKAQLDECVNEKGAA